MKIHTLDLNFQGLSHAIAAYLVQGPAGYALVESGPMTTLPSLQQRLAEHGVSPGEIGAVFLTHIHLDHAGAAGWWAQQGTQVYVHHVGARHLVDPTKLWRSAGRIYGDQMEPLWGSMPPAPAGNVTAIYDNDDIEAAGLTFTALDTPGHASHHHAYRLGDVIFSGDAVGVRMPGSGWVSLPAPPPEFNLQAWDQTLDRLEAAGADAFYLTHFGRVEDCGYQVEALRATMHAAATYVREQMETGVERDQLVERYVAWNLERANAAGLSEAAFKRHQSVNSLAMSVDGIIRYWRKQAGN